MIRGPIDTFSGVGVTFVCLSCGGVFVLIRRGNIMGLDKCVDSAVLPSVNLLMVEALCGVGEN